MACKWVHANVAKIFMDNSTSLRIDLNAKDNIGHTALHMAFKWGHVIVANMIIDNSATLSIDLDAKDNKGQTAFNVACH